MRYQTALRPGLNVQAITIVRREYKLLKWLDRKIFTRLVDLFRI